jgi:protein phosphatase
MRVYVGSGTDQGRIKRSNQDAVGVDLASGLFLVADGVSGNVGGDIASGIIVAAAKAYVAAAKPSYEDRKSALLGGIGDANAQILRRAVAENKKGMSSTVTAFLIGSGKYFVAWAGDSRAYLIRGTEILQVTKDHSHVQQLVDRGIITPEEARHHDNRNVITRAVGLDPDMEIDTCEGEFRETDALLACSDGLWGELTDKEMLDTILGSEDGQQACNALIEQANAKGGHDNISVVLAQSSPTMRRVLPAKTRSTPARLIPRALANRNVLTGTAVVAVLAAAIVLLSRLVRPHPSLSAWVTFETQPETLNVKSAKDGLDKAVHSGESIQVRVPSTLVFSQTGYVDTAIVVSDPAQKVYKVGLRSPLVQVTFVLPPDAAVLFKKSGTRASEVESLPIGSYALRCERSGYQPCDTVLQVSSASPVTFVPDLGKRQVLDTGGARPPLPSTPIKVVFSRDERNGGAKVVIDGVSKTVPCRFDLKRGQKYTAVLQLKDGTSSKPRPLREILTSRAPEVSYPSSAFDFR